MTYEELKNGMKSLFSSLGAKTSDSNYGVALLDKTSGEPKGLMGMSDLASVLGGSRIQEITIQANSYIDVTVSKNSFYKLWPGSEIGSSLTFILTTEENDYQTPKLVFFGTSWAKDNAYKLSIVNSSTIRLAREQSTNYAVHLQQISW